MLAALTALLVFQLIGEVVSVAFGLPVPGPVIGMVLLFLALAVKGSVPADLQTTGQGLLSHLSLLFVPAGVGVLLHAHLVAEEWPAITAALVGSTLLTIAVTALVMKWLMPNEETDET